MEAWSGIAMGFMGVVLTLRVKFAQTITLGHSIGTIGSKTLEPLLTKPLSAVIPREYHRWVPVIIVTGCKIAGISLAWFVHRIIEAFYSAVRGAELFARGLLRYLSRRGYIKPEKINQNSPLFTAICMVVAFLGFVWQFRNGFSSLPFPLNILLFPLTIAEWALMYFIGIR